MSFSSEIFIVPKLSSRFDVQTSLALYLYASFMADLDSSWYKEQMAKGINFNFSEKYGGYPQKFLPKSSDELEYYKNYYTKYYDYFHSVRDPIDSPILEDFYSCGRDWHSLIFQYSSPVYTEGWDDFRMLTYDNILSMLRKLETHRESCKFESVQVNYSFKKDKGTDELILTPCDGLELEFEDGSLRRIYNDEEYLFKLSEGKEIGDFYTLENLISALKTAKHLTDSNYIIYVGG